MTLRRRLAAHFPPIARRDAELLRRSEKIRELTERSRRLHDHRAELHRAVRRLERRVAGLEERAAQLQEEVDRRVVVEDYLAVPSFRRALLTLRRTSVDLRTLDPEQRHPLRQLPFKLRNYGFAGSHGVPVPEVLEVWSTPQEMILTDLPDSFVLKSDGGAGSHGVLPLRRAGDDTFETLDGARALTGDEVRAHFADRAAEDRISGPFFAESVLRQPGGGAIPDDVKLYATYGRVQQVLLRRVSRHGDLRSTTRRYVAADGSDLGDAVLGEQLDRSIPVPDRLPEMVDIASHLSLAVGLPFVRVDVYDTDHGVVLGEVTRAPGGAQRIRPDHDEKMGRAWEEAAYRLDLDLVAGRPAGLLHGDQGIENFYPAGHVSRSEDPGAWAPKVVPCGRWCPAPGPPARG